MLIWPPAPAPPHQALAPARPNNNGFNQGKEKRPEENRILLEGTEIVVVKYKVAQR
jgi:hypothetical protein